MPISSNDYTGNFILDFSPSGIVTLNLPTVMEFEIAQFNMDASITGKYECYGKALCIIFNNDVKTSYNITYQDIVPQAKRNEIGNALKSVWPKLEKNFVKGISAYASAGLYSQILQLNDSLLIIKYPNQESQVFTHIK